MEADKILLVSYLFPPCGGVGVQRAVSYARYLGPLGCPVTVLTARNPATAVWDPGMLAVVPPEVRVHRTLTPEISYELRQKLWRRIAPGGEPRGVARVSGSEGEETGWKQRVKAGIQRALTPDPQRYWKWTALRRGERLIREEGIRNVLVTAPPFSTFSIGTALKRKFPQIKLISEFRDEWLGYYIKSDPNATGYRRQVAEKLERETVVTSDFIVTVTPAWAEEIRARYPDQPAEKFLCIPNGYDPQSFSGFRQRPHGSDRLVVTYLGTVYANPVYSPRPYINALNQLPDAIRGKIETRFIGRVVEEEIPALESCRGLVKRLGFLPQAEAFRHLEESDLLLLVVNTPGAHSGKFFEYLATGKPILAVSPKEGELARMMKETGSGWCVAADDEAGLKRSLEEAFRGIRKGEQSLLPKPDRERIIQYERPRLIEQLAAAVKLGKFR